MGQLENHKNAIKRQCFRMDSVCATFNRFMEGKKGDDTDKVVLLAVSMFAGQLPSN